MGWNQMLNQTDAVYELESDAADHKFISTQPHSMYAMSANDTTYELVPANETVATV